MAGSVRSAVLFAMSAVTVAGCGGAHRATPHPPKLPRELAAQLATLSDSVAAQLESGNDCGALAVARQLDTQTAAAIDGGRVPVSMRQPLRRAADDLVAGIQCTRPPPAEHGKPKKGEEHGKHKGHGGDGG